MDEPAGYLYDFYSPDDPTEIVTDWFAQSMHEVKKCGGVNVRPLYLRPAQQEEKPEPVAWMYTGIKNDGITHGPHLCWKPEHMDAMSASKGAVAAPLYTFPPKLEHRVEPVAYVPVHPRNGPLWSMTTDAPSPERLPSYPMMSLYTAPPQSEFVGLTDEEVASVLGFGEYTVGSAKVILLAIAHTVEAKLKEKNT